MTLFRHHSEQRRRFDYAPGFYRPPQQTRPRSVSGAAQIGYPPRNPSFRQQQHGSFARWLLDVRIIPLFGRLTFQFHPLVLKVETKPNTTLSPKAHKAHKALSATHPTICWPAVPYKRATLYYQINRRKKPSHLMVSSSSSYALFVHAIQGDTSGGTCGLKRLGFRGLVGLCGIVGLVIFLGLVGLKG